jgi:hypothetical protein
MKKIKFSELLKQDNVTIHTPTEKQAKKLFKKLNKLGYKWTSRTKLTTETWHGIYKENTCYNFDLNKKVLYGPLSLYQKCGYTIIEFTDIDFSNDDTLKKANTLRIVYIVSMMVLFFSIVASLLLFDLDNKIFFVLTIALSLILIGIGIVAEQKSEDNYDKVHDEEIKNLKLGYEDELISSGNKLYETLEEKNKLARKIKALRDYKGIYIDKSITSDGVPSKESLLKDIGDDIDLLTPPTLTEDKGIDIKTIYHNKEKGTTCVVFNDNTKVKVKKNKGNKVFAEIVDDKLYKGKK